MTLKVHGMTLSEIEAKFKEFDEEKRKQEAAYKAGKLPQQSSMPNFTPDEAYDFADEIYKSVDKAVEEVERRIDDEGRKKELIDALEGLMNLQSECRDIKYNRHPSF